MKDSNPMMHMKQIKCIFWRTLSQLLSSHHHERWGEPRRNTTGLYTGQRRSVRVAKPGFEVVQPKMQSCVHISDSSTPFAQHNSDLYHHEICKMNVCILHPFQHDWVCDSAIICVSVYPFTYYQIDKNGMFLDREAFRKEMKRMYENNMIMWNSTNNRHVQCLSAFIV